MSTVPWVHDGNIVLLTDLYELTMVDAYLAEGLYGEATFELFVRRLPPERAFLVAAGVDDAVSIVEALRFDDRAISALANLGVLSETALDAFSRFKFHGDIWAVPEGEIVFAGEPLVRVTAPLIEAQILETLLLNTILFQTSVASKAARVTLAARGKPWADFSARRDHGADAALKAARAAYIGGAASTSNVLASIEYSIPASGTMAHSFILSFEHEADAFHAYARRFRESTILLIDTFDTLEGARWAAAVSAEFRAAGVLLRGVRLDSGDLLEHSRAVRAILDEASEHHLAIFASGDLDEYAISALVQAGAPVDSFGVGTRLGTSEDAPSLSGVYKLVENHLGPRAKYSDGKRTLPLAKQVHRFGTGGAMTHDLLSAAGESISGGRPLLRQVLAGGHRVAPVSTPEEARARRAAGVASLPASLRTIGRSYVDYSVEVSEGLKDVASRVARSLPGDRINP